MRKCARDERLVRAMSLSPSGMRALPVHSQYYSMEDVPGTMPLASPRGPSISSGCSARHMLLQAHLGREMWVACPK